MKVSTFTPTKTTVKHQARAPSNVSSGDLAIQVNARVTRLFESTMVNRLSSKYAQK